MVGKIINIMKSLNYELYRKLYVESIYSQSPNLTNIIILLKALINKKEKT